MPFSYFQTKKSCPTTHSRPLNLRPGISCESTPDRVFVLFLSMFHRYRALQPGQQFALYHVSCTVTTRGHFYLPSRFEALRREHPANSGSHPFQNPLIPGTWSVLRQNLSTPSPVSSPPVFHPFIIALGLLLSNGVPGNFEMLGIGQSLCILPPVI